MLLQDRWKQLSLWTEHSPLWFQFTLFPFVAPAVMGVAAACLFPRIVTSSIGLLAVVYGLAIRGGLIDWLTIGRNVGVLYLTFVIPMYVAMVEHHSKRLYTKCFGTPVASGVAAESPGQPTDA